ncbi:MAG: hypothetical protein CMF62_02620 [Magnetococcales bacterium]|nr:hypothetical protein [Magnetococcales bacterium]|tara:strand:- start:69088 stop:69504 length:417 start_codon:yes stop_codon:yes gene_type:complete
MEINIEKIKTNLKKQKFENELEYLTKEGFSEDRIKKLKRILENLSETSKTTTKKSSMDKFIEEIEKYAFRKKWNRLSESHKLVKIKEFCNETFETDVEKGEKYKMLEKMVFENKLKTQKQVDYDPQDEKIIEIYCLND